MNIEFKEDSVCYADGEYWIDNGLSLTCEGEILPFEHAISIFDFQLNEPREGYYIPKSELDTEEKYNQVVEVFGLFGFNPDKGENFNNFGSPWDNLVVYFDGALQSGLGIKNPVKLTYPQLMAIGELKRKMIERDKLTAHTDLKNLKDSFNNKEVSAEKRNKSKQAYSILNSLDYEYDLVKRQWYKKQFI